MANQRLVDYIKNSMASGATADSIKQALLQQGWNAAVIDEAMKVAEVDAKSPGKGHKKTIIIVIVAVVAVIALLLVVMVLPAMLAWSYLSTTMNTYTEKSFTVSTGGVFCDMNQKIHVRVVNTGTETLTSSDWTANRITDSSGDTVGAFSVSSVNKKEAKEFIFSCGSKCASGESYTVEIGTAYYTQRVPVICP